MPFDSTRVRRPSPALKSSTSAVETEPKLRPLPFENPEQLAFVWTRLPATNVPRSLVSGPDFKDDQTETGSHVVTVELSDRRRATRDIEIIRLPGAT